MTALLADMRSLIAAKRAQRPDAPAAFTQGIDDACRRLTDAPPVLAWSLDAKVSK